MLPDSSYLEYSDSKAFTLEEYSDRGYQERLQSSCSINTQHEQNATEKEVEADHDATGNESWTDDDVELYC